MTRDPILFFLFHHSLGRDLLAGFLLSPPCFFASYRNDDHTELFPFLSLLRRLDEQEWFRSLSLLSRKKGERGRWKGLFHFICMRLRFYLTTLPNPKG